MSSVRNFSPPFPPWLLRMHCRAVSVQTTLSQQLLEPSHPYSNLQPWGASVATPAWSIPHTSSQGLAPVDAHHAGPVCPGDILPTLMACGGIPNPTLTQGASPLSQGECPCSPCVSELLSRQNPAHPGGSGGSPSSGLCCCQSCCPSQHPARRCLH